MKNKLILFILLFSGPRVFCQTVQSSCAAVDSIEKKYLKTADKLAILRCVKTGNTFNDSVEINQQLSSEYLRALVAVYNATALPARDTVISLNITLDYLIYPATNMVSIQVDSNQTWLKNIRNNVFPCGNTGIDYLIDKFYLKKHAYYDYFQSLAYHGVMFKTDTNYYMNRLADKFNALYQQGVLSAAPQTQSSPSYSLTDSVNVSFKELTYGFNWGDCTAGCLYHRFWKFKVNTDCSVEYKGSYGDALPPGIYTGIEEIADEHSVIVYPNPVFDQLKIRTKGLIDNPMKIKIYDINGRIIFADTIISNSENTINVESISNGFYFLHIRSKDRVSVQKILINKP